MICLRPLKRQMEELSGIKGSWPPDSWLLHSDSLLLLLASLRQLVSTGAILHSWVLSHPSGPELQSSLCNCAAAVRSDVEHQYGHEVGNLGRVEIQSSFSRADRLWVRRRQVLKQKEPWPEEPAGSFQINLFFPLVFIWVGEKGESIIYWAIPWVRSSTTNVTCILYNSPFWWGW